MRITLILLVSFVWTQLTTLQMPVSLTLVSQTSATQTLFAQTPTSQTSTSQTPFAKTPDELKAMLPAIDGWTIVEETEVFHPDNLYDKINGAAPGFILFDFKELTVFEYNQNMTGDDLPPYISVQVYRHATPVDAFGIYASERPAETDFATIGAEGYQEGAMLNFFVDNLYVKIESPSTTADVVKAVRQIAQEFGRKVNDAPTFPPQLQFFPSDSKIARSELYIPSGFLGHEFLGNAFTAKYETSGKKYQLFIIDAGSVEQAKAVLNRYIQFTRQNVKLREGRLTIKDRFNGDLECQWKGQYIWGIINENNAPVNIDEVLKETGKIF